MEQRDNPIKLPFDNIPSNVSLPVDVGMQILSDLMDSDLLVVRSKFPASKGCNEVQFAKLLASAHPKISISFSIKDAKPPVQCTYMYDTVTKHIDRTY